MHRPNTPTARPVQGPKKSQPVEAKAAAGNRARLLAILTKNANSTTESLLAVRLREALARLAVHP